MAKKTAKMKAAETPAKPVQTKAQAKRVKAALEGKNFRKITLQITNEFPTIPTGHLSNMITGMLHGLSFYEDVLSAIEDLGDTEDSVK